MVGLLCPHCLWNKRAEPLYCHILLCWWVCRFHGVVMTDEYLFRTIPRMSRS